MGWTRLIRAGMDRALCVVNVALFGLMVLIGTYQIVTRYCFNRPSTVTEELLTYTFTWLSLLAASYIFGRKGHMRMGFLADRLAARAGRWLEMAAEAISFLFSAIVLVYGGVAITTLAMSQKTASLGIPKGYIYLVIPLCGILIMAYNVLNLTEMAQGMREGKGGMASNESGGAHGSGMPDDASGGAHGSGMPDDASGGAHGSGMSDDASGGAHGSGMPDDASGGARKARGGVPEEG